LGTLPQKKPVFEDPARTFGKRGYLSGDSIRRIDWKSTAATGQLQVKLFEPSIALEMMIFLNLNRDDYEPKRRADLIELAIVVAASIAYWGIINKQYVGLSTNGIDPVNEGQQFNPLFARKGRTHLTRILELLARINPGYQESLTQLVRRVGIHLTWGTTVITITGESGPNLFEELFKIRRAGINIAVVFIGEIANWPEIKLKADSFGFPIFHVKNEFDLDIWRK
jgi:uncharacterized protein (DUF58 family)